MPTKHEAFCAWLGGFGMPAYAEGCVPDGARMPYLTYQPQDGALFEAATVPASLWMRTEGEAPVNAKAAEISRALPLGGAVLPCDEGALWLRRGSPFCQAAESGEKGVKRRLINIEIEYFTHY